MLNCRFCCLFSSTSSAQCSISFHGFIGISFTKSSSRLFSRCYSCSYSTREHGQLLFTRPLRRCQRSTQYDKPQRKEASLEKAPHSDVLIHALFFPHHPQTVRGIKTLDFAGSKEVVYERSDWPLAKLHDYFKNDTLALIGYGSQGHGQGLNARDNGLNVIVGVRKDGESWKQAMEDGWVRDALPIPL